MRQELLLNTRRSVVNIPPRPVSLAEHIKKEVCIKGLYYPASNWSRPRKEIILHRQHQGKYVKLTLFFIFSSTILLSACGSSSGSDNSANSRSAISSSTASSVSSSLSSSNNSFSSLISSSSGNISALIGTWSRDCAEENPGEADTLYDTVKLTFEDSAAHTDINVYEDSACTIPFLHAPNPTASGTYTIGDSFTSVEGLEVIELDTHITEMNGAEFDILEYTIFYIDGNRLYMGENSDDSQDRPTSLDFIRVFYKQ